MLAPPETRAFSAVVLCAQGCRQYPRHCPFGLQSWGPRGWTCWRAWTVASGPVLQAGGRGAAGDILSPISGKTPDISTRYWYIVTLHTHWERHWGFFVPNISIFQYFLQYLDHIGPDIGEKPDMGFGKEQVCPNIDPILLPISGKNPISGTILVISGLARNGYVMILSRYRRWYYQYRVLYLEKWHNIVYWWHDIGNSNIGTHPDIGPSVVTILGLI